MPVRAGKVNCPLYKHVHYHEVTKNTSVSFSLMVRAHHLIMVHFQFRLAQENCLLLFSEPVQLLQRTQEAPSALQGLQSFLHM